MMMKVYVEGSFVIMAEQMNKGNYEHFMLKEIDEQPAVIRHLINEYTNANQVQLAGDVRQSLLAADTLYIIACGTSYHAGLVGKDLIEKWAQVPVEVHIASEFAYNMPLLSKNPLFIFISQSGETTDSLLVFNKVKELGYKTLTLANVPDSTLVREATHALLLHAGPEVAIASTKAYMAQLVVLTMIAADLANQKGLPLPINVAEELANIADVVEAITADKEPYKMVARDYFSEAKNCFFLGRTMDYYTALEASLKLKEVSYIYAQGYGAGEFKHGTMALIDEGMPIFAVSTQKNVSKVIHHNMKEIASLGAKTCVISTTETQEEGDQIVIPAVYESLSPLVSIVPFQIIAYYTALQLGRDVDSPRNLTKAVVEE